MTEQFIHETSDLSLTDWKTWGFVKVSFPVKIPCALEGRFNHTRQISYPANWLTSRKEDSSLSGNDEGVYFRQMHIVPSGAVADASSGGTVYNGATPFALWMGKDHTPNYWHSTYITGFDKVPRELIDTVGKLTAIQLLTQMGDVWMGIGTNNYSVALDGLSQSISLLKSGDYGVFGSRIKQFGIDLYGADGKGGDIETLKAKYKGIIWDCV